MEVHRRTGWLWISGWMTVYIFKNSSITQFTQQIQKSFQKNPTAFYFCLNNGIEQDIRTGKWRATISKGVAFVPATPNLPHHPPQAGVHTYIHTRAHTDTYRDTRVRALTSTKRHFPGARRSARLRSLGACGWPELGGVLLFIFRVWLDRFPVPSRTKCRCPGWRRKAALLSPLVQSSTSGGRR